MVVPALWQQLLALALAKKVAVVTIAYLYGIPRLYRRSQKAVRFLAKDPKQRRLWASRMRSGFRAPAHLLSRFHGGAQPQQRIVAQPAPRELSSRAGMYSFASSPLISASNRRLQSQLAEGRQRWRSAAALVRNQGSQLRQRLSGRMQALSGVPSADAVSMAFLRRARQAYCFVPAVFALP